MLGRRLQANLAVVLLHDALADGETDAGATGLVGIEDLEDPGDGVGGDNRAAVGEAAALGAVGHHRRLEDQIAPLRGMVHRVDQDVEKDLRQLLGVDSAGNGGRWARAGENQGA